MAGSESSFLAAAATEVVEEAVVEVEAMEGAEGAEGVDVRVAAEWRDLC